MRAPPAELAGYGQHIYAYCNVRTNQVLYSLKRNLDKAVLKQLPDIGANHTPPAIRPDLWRPLYTVTIPTTAQGLLLFRKLKEWRKLHELCWEPPSYLSRPHTEKEIEAMKERLENRGGSKKETVYDLLKRKKKKMRQNIIMNQKANSIADLAAVLIEQDEQGARLAEERQRDFEKRMKSEMELILKLAEEAEEGGLKKLQDEIEMMKAMLNEGVEGFKLRIIAKKDNTRKRLQQMFYAAAAVKNTKEWAQLSQRQRQMEMDYWKEMVENGEHPKPKYPEEGEDLPKPYCRAAWSEGAFATVMHRDYKQTWEQVAIACRAERYTISKPEPDAEGIGEQEGELSEFKQSEVEQSTPEEPKASQSSWNSMLSKKQSEPEAEVGKQETQEPGEDIDFKTVLPCFPPRFDPDQTFPQHMPKKGPKKYAMQRKLAPIFTTEGVKVEWANFLDAEFAEAWPEAVQHERMSGKKEKIELYDQKKSEMQEKWETELAEMVELKRREMGLPSSTEVEAEEDELERSTAAAEEAATQEKSDEEIAAAEAAQLAAAEELEAKENAAREAAVKALKDIRNKRRLPPQLEGVQSEILDRVRAKAMEGGWGMRGMRGLKSRLREPSQPVAPQDMGSESSPPPPPAA